MLRSSEGRIVIAAVALLLLAIALLLPGKTLTGFVVYEGDFKEHNFAFDSLVYDRSAVNDSANELKLNLTAETKSYDTIEAEIINVSSAYYDWEDKTNRVRNIDGDFLYVNKNELFNVKFWNNLSNNSKIQIYLISGDITEIYLCPYFQNCASPGYGKTSYDGNMGYYNITLSNMPYNRSSFNIDPPVKVKFDYIRAIKEYNITHYYDVSYYPMQAAIETDDFVPDSVYSWQSLVVDEQLNDQVIEYNYSTDSGSTWHYISNKDISSADPSSGKIRLRILLTSDGNRTPIIRNISVMYYEKTICNPDWQPDNNPCMADDSRLITYNDTNVCNTTENLPADNGTYAFCDFCAPEWEEVNTTCLPDNTINQYFIDLNSCYWQTYLESDNNPPGNNTFSCDYCVPLLLEQNTSCYGNGTFTTYYGDINGCYEITGLVSDIIPPNITNACPSPADGQESDEETAHIIETLLEYPEKGLSLKVEAFVTLVKSDITITDAEIALPQALEEVYSWNITADSSIKSNISSISLRFYYTASILNASDINESTLGIYYYDEQYEEIGEIPSMIKKTGGYVEANMTHLSVYGLYGRQNLIEQADSQATQPESGGNRQADSQSSAEEGSLPEKVALNHEMEGLSSEEKDAAADEGETADTPGNNENKLSLSPYYEYGEGAEQNSTFDIIRRIIRRDKEKNYTNATAIGILWFLMLVTYLLVQAKKRKESE